MSRTKRPKPRRRVPPAIAVAAFIISAGVLYMMVSGGLLRPAVPRAVLASFDRARKNITADKNSIATLSASLRECRQDTSTIYEISESYGFYSISEYFDGKGKKLSSYTGGDDGRSTGSKPDLEGYSCRRIRSATNN